MVEPSGHCPYLGLKQNRAIRFASPTGEHRCYISGDPQEIPVDQAQFCLSADHVRCPLYTGLGVPTISASGAATLAPLAPPRRGLVGWLAGLSKRDRAIYGALLALLVAIIGIYLVAGAQLLTSALGQEGVPTPSQVVAPAATATEVPPPPSATTAASATIAASATPVPATATDIPLSPTSTLAPATKTVQVILIPTDRPPLPTALPTATEEPPDAPPPVLTELPTVTDSPIPVPTDTAAPAAPTDTAAPVVPSATSAAPEPTATTVPPTDVPPPPPPTDVPPPPPTEAPPATATAAPFRQAPAILYFPDTSGSVMISVRRTLTVQGQRIAEAVVRSLIDGPRSSRVLAPVFDPGTRLLSVTKSDRTLLVDLDRRPGDRAFYALALSLTELSGVEQVQVLVHGAPVDPTGAVGPLSRPVINIDNPAGQASAYSSGTRFLPLYFLYGGYQVRVTRLVSRTDAVAQRTVEELLAGPGSYGELLHSAIPGGTELRGITLRGSEAMVNLSAAFAEATDRWAAIRALALALTDLRGAGGERRISTVLVQVEGRGLEAYWGAEFAGPLARPALNPE